MPNKPPKYYVQKDLDNVIIGVRDMEEKFRGGPGYFEYESEAEALASEPTLAAFLES